MTSAGVVVDVGATGTRVAACRDGRLTGPVDRFATPSPRREPGGEAGGRAGGPVRSQAGGDRLAELRDELFDRIAERVLLVSGGRPAEVGVAFGAVLTTAGVIQDASVLWLAPSAGVDVTAALRRRLPGARITVLNDVAAAAWHYRALGRFAVVTVSSGVAIKVFDADASAAGLLLDPAGLGGESGHVVVEPTLVAGLPPEIGRAAADGDASARAELARRDLPWCECGAVADLCSYTSGPAVVRAAARLAHNTPDRFAASALAVRTGGDPDRIDAAAIAICAGADPFVAEVLRRATRALAARLLQVCADLGLRRVVVVGGFAHGVGEPWFAALRANLAELLVPAGWYAGWGPAERDGLVHAPTDAGDATLAGMAAYLAARAARVLVAVKPVGEGRLEVRERRRPRCGREQLLLRPIFAGICGTDLQILRGERGSEPGVPGHECVAEVAEVGADAADVALRNGDLVTLNPNNPLDDGDKLGHNGQGVFGELLAFDAGLQRRGQVVPLPRPAGAGLVLAEPLAAVHRAWTMLAAAGPGRRVLVVGGGVAGLLHMLLARHRGAEQVLLASRSAATRERAVRLGCCAPGQALPLSGGLAAAVLAATGGAGVDVAVVAVGGGAGPRAAGAALPALAAGGALHLFGGFPAGSVLPLAAGGELAVGPLRAAAATERVGTPSGRPAVVLGNRGGRRADLIAAVDLCRDLGVDRLVSHVVSMRSLPTVAAELARAGTVDGALALRVVVDLRLPGAVVRTAGPPLPEYGG